MNPRLRTTAAILLSVALPLAAYVASLRGGVGLWDTGDLQTVPFILGIPYPTGFPGYVVVGWVWSHVVVLGSVAWRMNLLSAVATAGAAGLLAATLIALDVLAPVAAGGALAFAFAGPIWDRATYVDAHRVGFPLIALALLFGVRWLRAGGVRDLWGAGLAFAGALAVDNTTLLALPGLALVLAGRRPPLRPALAVAAAGCGLVIAAYAYLPIRSAIVTATGADPTLALGLPPGRPFWDDHHPSSLGGFLGLVTGWEFRPGSAATALFSSRMPGALGHVLGAPMREDFGIVGLLLAAFGLGLLAVELPLLALGLAAVGLVPAAFAASYAAEADPQRYVAAAYLVLALGAAYAVSALLRPLRVPLLAAGALAAAAVLGFQLHADLINERHLFDQPADRGAATLVDRVAAVTPPNAILVSSWMYATPLAYGAYVERRLGSRVVVTANPRDVLRYLPRWLPERPVVLIDSALRDESGYRTQRLDDGDPPLVRVVTVLPALGTPRGR